MAENVASRRRYTKEFQFEAVQLAESVGQHEAACRLGVPLATLGNWCRGRRNGSAQAAAGPAPGQRPGSREQSSA